MSIVELGSIAGHPVSVALAVALAGPRGRNTGRRTHGRGRWRATTHTVGTELAARAPYWMWWHQGVAGELYLAGDGLPAAIVAALR